MLYFGILIIQFKTFGIIAKSLFNLPPEYEKLCVIGFAIFLSLYTFRRGFIAVALTDVLQFWVFIIALFSVVGFVAFKSNFFAGAWDKGVMENPKMSLAPCFKDYNATLFTLGLWFCSIFPKVNGPRYQRIMACDDAKKVKKSFLIASVILMVCTGCYTCISLLIYSQNPNLKMSEIVPFFVRNYCPTGLKGLLGAGLFAMSISTVESILNCNSVIFTNDILPYFSKMFSKKTYTPSVFVARCATVFFCFLGVLISLKFSDPFSILLVFSNFYYPVAMLPYVILVLNLNFNRASIFVGIFCGILGTIINYVLTKDVNSYTVGIFAHLVALLLTELIIRMKNKNNNSVTTID